MPNRFEAYFRPEFNDERTENSEKIIYVGCIHGADEKLLAQLAELAECPPEHIILLGDLAGTPVLEECKRRFYNLVTNRSQACLTSNPQIADVDLLSYVGVNPPIEAPTLRDGFLSLLRYQYELGKLPPEETDKRLAEISDEEMARKIREISPIYFGDYIKVLPVQIRSAMLKQLGNSAVQLADTLDTLRQKGSRISIITGNWDDLEKSGINVIAGDDITPFNTKKYLQERGFLFFDELTAMQTRTSVHVCVPYFELVDANYAGKKEKIREIAEIVAQARAAFKPVIMVGHAEANWEMHTLSHPKPANAERARVIRNFGGLMAALDPDQVVYAHQHNLRTDEEGRPIDLNAKYILEPEGDNVSLVEDSSAIGKPHQIVVTYIPLHHLAEARFSVRQRVSSVFNGSQSPIRVLSD